MSKSLAKSAIIVTISEIIYNVASFIVHGAVGRILGPEDYGRYGLVVTLTTMVIILIGNGIPTAMSKYISEIFESNPSLVRTIKKQAVILQSLLIGLITIIFFLLTPLISKLLSDPTLTPLFRISTLIIPMFAAASFYFSYFTGLHEFGIQSFLKISRSVFRLVFIIGLAYFLGVKGSIMGYIFAPLSVFLVAFIIDRWKIGPQFEKAEAKTSFDWKKLTNYAWQIVIFFLAYELLISIDLYMVKGILKSDYLTGIYNASLTIGRIPYYLFYALTVILLPAVSKSTAEKDDGKTTKLITESLRIMFILLIPSVVLMSVFAEPVINIFYGQKYAGAGYPMSILVWGVGFLTVFYVLSFVMNGAGKVKTSMYISIIGLILNTILNYFFIHYYGIMGSAIATSVVSATIAFIMLYFVWKDFGVKIQLKSFIKMLLAGIITYAASLLFSKGNLVFIPWSVILFVFYLFILYTLREIKKEDLQFLAKSFGFKK